MWVLSLHQAMALVMKIYLTVMNLNILLTVIFTVVLFTVGAWYGKMKCDGPKK